MSFYNGERCDYATNRHVFEDEQVSSICECGVLTKKFCRCADCGMRHEALVDTPPDRLLSHRLWRMETRLADLERPAIPPAAQEQPEDENQQLLQ